MHCLRYLSHVYIRLYILMLPVVCEKLAVLTRVKVFITIRPLMPLKIVTQWQKSTQTRSAAIEHKHQLFITLLFHFIFHY